MLGFHVVTVFHGVPIDKEVILVDGVLYYIDIESGELEAKVTLH